MLVPAIQAQGIMLPCFLQAILNALFKDRNEFRGLSQVTLGRSVLLGNRSWL